MDKMKNVGFLLKDLSRRYVARFEKHAQELSLTLMQCKALAQLEKNEGASQARLAELTDIEPMMMVRLLDRMEEDKLIERRADPSDRRARRLFLTKKAKPLLEEIWRLAEITRSEMFVGINKADREAFLDVLERVHANACALDKQASPRSERPALKRPASRSTRTLSS
jgi:MarR family transcriptional regulator, transcriptional regulator for hemolysin